MRFTVRRSKLIRRLGVVERIIPKKGGLPGHHVVSIKASASRLVLSVSGQKEQYRTTFDAASVQTRGQVAIPAAELIRIVEAAPDMTLTIDDSEQTISVTSGAAIWQITPLAGAGYLAADMVLPERSSSITATELFAALTDIRYAASTTDARPSLRQIYFGSERAVAADGRRLHLIPTEFDGEFSIPEGVVDILLDALRAEGPAGGIISSPVKVYNTDQVVYFEHEGFVLGIGKLSYQFPDVEALILTKARSQKGSLTMRREPFMTALRVAAVSVGDVGHIEMRQTGNVLRITGTSTASQAMMHVELLDDPGMEDFEMVLPVEALLQAVAKLVSDRVTARVVLPGESDPGWFYVDEEGEEIAIRGVSRL